MRPKTTLYDQSDQAWGIERSKDSDYHGHIVVPVIYVFSEPARRLDIQVLPGNLMPLIVGGLAHGQEVTVQDSKRVDGFMWYKIFASKANVLRKHPINRKYKPDKKLRGKGNVAGWVRSTLLKKRGLIK